MTQLLVCLSALLAAHAAVYVLAVSSAEDPEKLLDQVVNEMQEDLIKMRQASAQVCALGSAHMPAMQYLYCSLCNSLYSCTS